MRSHAMRGMGVDFDSVPNYKYIASSARAMRGMGGAAENELAHATARM
jgi:hypothetical protein